MTPKSSRHRPRPPVAPLLHASEDDATEELAIKACHDALRAEPVWTHLRLDGFMPAPDSNEEALELRRCPQCGSSLAKRVPRASVFAVLRDTAGIVSRSLDALAPSMQTLPRGSKGSRHA